MFFDPYSVQVLLGLLYTNLEHRMFNRKQSVALQSLFKKNYVSSTAYDKPLSLRLSKAEDKRTNREKILLATQTATLTN
mgnify:CR=1 FL=1